MRSRIDARGRSCPGAGGRGSRRRSPRRSIGQYALGMLWIDHVIYGVEDLEAARSRFESEYGLPVVDGGMHPGGTRNAVVLCQDGATYVELLAVHDPMGPTARWLSEMLAEGDRWCGWAVRTDDIEKVAVRLGIATRPGSIQRADGTVGPWTVAGNRQAAAESHLPFFIDYGASRPVRTAPPNAPLAVAWVEVGGERGRVSEWRGSDLPGVRVIAGTPGLRAVGLAMPGGEIELRLGQ
jgi:hypothetical protein